MFKIMKTYYSIIYYGNNNNERINCGLILFDDDINYIRLNKSKMLVAKKFISEGYFLFRSNLKAMVAYYNYNQPTLKELDRLSRYMNNMTKITAPTPIAIDCTQENFDKLFDKFIAWKTN